MWSDGTRLLKGHGHWGLGASLTFSTNICDSGQVKESVSNFLVCGIGIKLVSTSNSSCEESPAMHKHHIKFIAILMMMKPRLIRGVSLSRGSCLCNEFMDMSGLPQGNRFGIKPTSGLTQGYCSQHLGFTFPWWPACLFTCFLIFFFYS